MPRKSKQTESDDRCPNCGYCKHCGQAKPVQVTPPPVFVPYIQPSPYVPWWQSPWYGGSVMTLTGTAGIDGTTTTAYNIGRTTFS